MLLCLHEVMLCLHAFSQTTGTLLVPTSCLPHKDGGNLANLFSQWHNRQTCPFSFHTILFVLRQKSFEYHFVKYYAIIKSTSKDNKLHFDSEHYVYMFTPSIPRRYDYRQAIFMRLLPRRYIYRQYQKWRTCEQVFAFMSFKQKRLHINHSNNLFVVCN